MEEHGWPKDHDPADISMMEHGNTSDDEYDRCIHREINESWIKQLLREKAITHPNQLPWYTPEEFNIYPTFYSNASSGANDAGGEQQ
jgi:hypothetical protein